MVSLSRYRSQRRYDLRNLDNFKPPEVLSEVQEWRKQNRKKKYDEDKARWLDEFMSAAKRGGDYGADEVF